MSSKRVSGSFVPLLHGGLLLDALTAFAVHVYTVIE